jgi:hypothetical protein
MRSRITTGFAAVAFGAILVSVPAFAQNGKQSVPTYSNTGPGGAPLSPGGISAAASAYMGPGYSGPSMQSSPAKPKPMTYSVGGPDGAPLSPGGISAAASAFRGPGYSGPTQAGSVRAVTYSNTSPQGAPLSPGGISAAANAFRGPGYVGP